MKTVLEIVRSKVSSTYDDEQCQDAIDEIGMCIVSYCNLDDEDDIPEELYYTWANMSHDLLKPLTNDDIEDIDSSRISNIKIGDTSISLRSAANEINIDRTNSDTIIASYYSQLNKFKKLR